MLLLIIIVAFYLFVLVVEIISWLWEKLMEIMGFIDTRYDWGNFPDITVSRVLWSRFPHIAELNLETSRYQFGDNSGQPGNSNAICGERFFWVDDPEDMANKVAKFLRANGFKYVICRYGKVVHPEPNCYGDVLVFKKK